MLAIVAMVAIAMLVMENLARSALTGKPLITFSKGAALAGIKAVLLRGKLRLITV